MDDRKLYDLVCWYLNNSIPSKKRVAAFNHHQALEFGKNYFYTWGMTIQRIEVYDFGEIMQTWVHVATDFQPIHLKNERRNTRNRINERRPRNN